MAPHLSSPQGIAAAADAGLAGALVEIARQTTDAVMLTDSVGIILWVNAAFEGLTGHVAASACGLQPERLLEGPATDRLSTKRLRSALLSGASWRGEVQHYRKDETPFWHEITLSMIAGHNGSAGYRLCLGRDVSERRTVARRFLELSAVVELSLDGIAVLAEDQRIRFANRSFARLHGYDTGAELQGMDWRDFFDEAHRRAFDQQIMGQLAMAEQWSGTVTGRRLDGSAFPEELTLSMLSGGMAIVARDITERTEYEQALRHMTLEDALTGLYNRRGFALLAQQLLNGAGRHAGCTLLLYFDLNRFKAINDSLGHHAGDLALVEVAEVLRETFRESDLIGRLGGDEFVVLAVNSLDPTGEVLLARLDQRLNARNAAPGRAYILSMSRGVATFDPLRPRSLQELLEEADARMLRGKRGRATGDGR